VLIAGANAVTYSSATLNDADEIYCEMISNLADVIASPCTSNVVLMDVTGAVGINSISNKIDFEISPNPANEVLNVRLSLVNGEQAIISIENMLGQVVCTAKSTQQANQFNISTFVSGVYFVRVQRGNAYAVKRLVVN
jgi:hypothetical protein